MKVKELIGILKEVDPNLTVICERYSDYMEQEEPEVIEVMKNSRGYTRYYSHQWKDKPNHLLRLEKVLLFHGN